MVDMHINPFSGYAQIVEEEAFIGRLVIVMSVLLPASFLQTQGQG